MKTKIALLAIVLTAMAFIQATPTRTVTGVVTHIEDGSPMPGISVLLKGTSTGTSTDEKGAYSLTIPDAKATLTFSFIGMKSKDVVVGISAVVDVQLEPELAQLSEVIVTALNIPERKSDRKSKRTERLAAAGVASDKSAGPASYEQQPAQEFNTEEYDGITENIFHGALANPLSTFSIDVDAASYSNVRRFITSGQQPPKEAVRIEEMINYFHYDYEQPSGEDPFAIHTEISAAPWNAKHRLVSIGLQGRKIATDNLPPSNLVFLIDVSGSMSDANKLPLLKSSFRMLVEKLRPQDHVAIVVYAGAAGLVLPSTSGAEKSTIIAALDNLQAGGSTAGGAGIELAYATAKENFRKEGNNRVILATDGDFNVGASSNGSMEELISEKRKDGVFLTVLGFGMGNYKDSKMEILADKGNGNYTYIDSFQEAQKVLVNEFGGTLFTIAKDVKLQIEFNPAKVKAYRLIGYENRMLKSEDFNNDKKDAGELGSGHTVTALYEIIPTGVDSEFFKTDPLKYQTTKIDPAAAKSTELMTVKFRYKKPDSDVSKLIIHPLVDENISSDKTSDNFRWSAAVAGFGMILRKSEFARDFTATDVLRLAQGARGKDVEGYRGEFIQMVTAQGLLATK